MSSNIFKQIFYKHLSKDKEPITKFEDDVESLKGEVFYHQIDPKTGSIIRTSNINNAIVNGAKSTVIRLLSQGLSPYKGQIDPIQYKISKMRFGNYNSYIPPSGSIETKPDFPQTPLNYYDITERAYRINYTTFSNAVGSDRAGAGGGGSNPLDAYSPSNGIVTDVGSTASYNINFIGALGTSEKASFTDTSSPTNPAKIIIISNNLSFGSGITSMNKRAPSHGSFKIDLLQGAIVIETLLFSGIYNKSNNGNTGIHLTGGGLISPNIINSASTKLIWKKSDGGRWELEIKLNTNIATNNTPENTKWNSVTGMRISFTIGEYNIINSIIPVTSFNRGVGNSLSSRFGGSDDFYRITGSPEYIDSPTNAIDDYAVSFGITMNSNQGNGAGDSKVRYTEAFLFTENDELFSQVRFVENNGSNSAGMGPIKDASSAYYIVWRIKTML